LARDKRTGGHYSNQYDYIDLNTKISVLKFENLEEEFNALMKKFKISLTLNKTHNKNPKKFTLDDMSDELIKLIKHEYKDDFINFNYSFDINDAK
jgi:hypothetical protein